MDDSASNPLIGADGLRDLLAPAAAGPVTGELVSAPAVRVADVRWYLGRPGAGRAAWEAGHLPGALFVDFDSDLTTPVGPGRHPLPTPAAFLARMAALGISADDLVVAYDDAGAGVAARLWWMLDVLGHRRVRVLDGGIGAWVAAGGALETGAPAGPVARVAPPADPGRAEGWARTIDRGALRVRLGDVRLIDVRAPERYRGDVEPIDRVAGHIPTAVNAPLAGNLTPDGRFLPPEVLRARFEGLPFPAPADRPVVVSCGSGANACQTALAMRVAGLPDPILYPGSYSDWSASDYPVATGDDPGPPA
jgi:thiosulfate/3-mercaptopyruvate sulfurtransferase